MKTETTVIKQISNFYKEKQPTKLDELKALNKKAKRPANIFAYTFGSISSLVLGTGMCLTMKVIGNSMALGICIGVVGLGLVIATYPIYKAILKKRKQKYGAQIVELSNELLNN